MRGAPPMKALVLLLVILNLSAALWIWRQQQLPAPGNLQAGTTGETNAQQQGASGVNVDSKQSLILIGELAPAPAPELTTPTTQGATGSAADVANPRPPAAKASSQAAAKKQPADKSAQNKPAAKKPPAKVATAKKPAAATAGKARIKCYTLGAFATAQTAQKASNILRPHSIEVSYRSSRVQSISGYRVYLPAQASHQRAKQMAAKLVAAGFSDYYIIAADKKRQQHAISLGLFSKKAGAIKHAARVRSKGFQVKIEYQYSDKQIYWVDYKADTKKLSNKTINRAISGNKKIQKLDRLCS